ncbi:MAG: DNA-3-methyladenine glycosylase family protein, partial [Limisphaerales bacterium]
SPPMGAREKTECVFAFPTSARLAACTESELRGCKMGFRAPYVAAAAQAVVSGARDLHRLHSLSTAEARTALMALPGVGRKIADCVLLFAYGKQDAFPVDVWMRRALTELYFPRRRPSAKRLEKFANTHFGPNAGYAQQYLFHYVRVKRVVSN